MSYPPNPETDGVDHINVYSQGKTELGKFLSNFYFQRMIIEDKPFTTIEGYWYWLICKDDVLCNTPMNGYTAKRVGKRVCGEMGLNEWDFVDSDFKKKIIDAIYLKIDDYDHRHGFKDEFYASTLPFKHYYNYGGKVIVPKGCDWMMEALENKRGNVT